MKILDIQSALLSNSEVLAHVQSIQAEHADNRDFTSTRTVQRDDGTSYEKLDGKLRDLAVVVADVIQHFSNADSALAAQANAGKTDAQARAEGKKKQKKKTTTDDAAAVAAREKEESRLHELLKRLRGFGLTKSELLMIANHRPQNEVVLDVLVEEMEGRLSAEQQQEIVRIVKEVYVGG